MSVLVECFSIIVRRSAIEQCYPGGLDGYERDCANRTFCADAHLVRVGFMAERDIGVFLLRILSRAGLARRANAKTGDVAIVSGSVAIVEQWRGPLHEAAWLEHAERPDRVCICWLKGTPPGDLRVPEGWSVGDDYAGSFVKLPASSKGTPVPPGELRAPKPAPSGFVTLYAKVAYGESSADDGE